MAKNHPLLNFPNLSRREQQIISAIYARKTSTTQQVLEDISDSSSYSSIRKIMQIMVQKGLLKYRRVGLKYVYEPVMEISQAQTSALVRVVKSLFNNSPASAIAAMLDSKDLRISQAELEELKQQIAKKSAQTSKKS